MNNKNKIVYAYSRSIRISPEKINKVLKQIREKTYAEALFILKFLTSKAAIYVWKTLHSAVSNGVKNFEFEKKNINICEAFATSGSILKRFRFGSKGRTFPIRKKMSNITIGIKNF